LKPFFSQKIDRIKSQLSTIADLVHEGDEEELVVLEKSGIVASRKLKGKTKARSMNGPKHVVFVEEGEEGKSRFTSYRMHMDFYLDNGVRYLRRAFEPCSCSKCHLRG